MERPSDYRCYTSLMSQVQRGPRTASRLGTYSSSLNHLQARWTSSRLYHREVLKHSIEALGGVAQTEIHVPPVEHTGQRSGSS